MDIFGASFPLGAGFGRDGIADRIVVTLQGLAHLVQRHSAGEHLAVFRRVERLTPGDLAVVPALQRGQTVPQRVHAGKQSAAAVVHLFLGDGTVLEGLPLGQNGRFGLLLPARFHAGIDHHHAGGAQRGRAAVVAQALLLPDVLEQFGAGGAGTFSDGKLNTLTKDKFFRNKEVLNIFVKHGAPKDILYLNKPHIGTDILRKVIKNIINEIINMGGQIKYNTCLTNIIIKDNKLTNIEINNKEIIPCENLILALGHSSRDTFEMLLKKGLNISPKPFAVGIRIQHPQFLIDFNQYGGNHLSLPPASYKLTYQTSKKRGVYSFCMCPGGYVVNASSEKEMLAINGMSNHNRDTKNANSAIIVTISPNDFGSKPLDGIKFQRKLEKKAYQIGEGKIPTQLFKDFVENKSSNELKNINPIFKGEYKLTNLRNIFPEYISEALIEGIQNFDKKIKGFASDDAILSAVESRTSSPIKMERDENFTSNIKGIYPCGEGAGYAGGITTSAIDGIKIAESIIKNYRPN